MLASIKGSVADMEGMGAVGLSTIVASATSLPLRKISRVRGVPVGNKSGLFSEL